MRKVKKKSIFDKLKKLTNKNKSTSKTSTRKINNSKRKGNASKKKVNKPKVKIKRSFWKKLLTVILILCIIGILLVAAFLAWIAITASPKYDESKFYVKDQTIIYDINGEVIDTIGEKQRESVTYDELPQVLIDAIIATEDSRFFQHNGVDLLRFLKASVLQVLGRSDAGGASTITMQVSKNNLTNTEKEGLAGIIRKFQDVYLAVFKIEKNFSKEEIIELYVNSYYLGGSAWGVEQASKNYFGKSVSELTLPEASLIAGLFQSPGKYDPYTNPENANQRRSVVLKLMYDHGYINKEEKDLANKVSVDSLLAGNNNTTEYQGYIDTVTAEVQKLTKNNPYTTPMKIYTTMNRNIQDGINKIMSNNDGYYWRDEDVQAGIAIVDVNTGALVAVGAGRNREGIGKLNYATQAYRQPGSTAKPVFDYGPGIEYNNFSSYTMFNDEPWTYTDGPSVNNWDGTFQGMITLRSALQYSRNVPALKAFQQVGTKNSQKFAYSLGLNVSLNQSSENYKSLGNGIDNTINEAYSIGGAAEGFTPLTMASAYAAFASGGYYTSPYTVTKIEYRDTGETLEYKPTKTRVMKDSTAYIMNNVLESAVNVGFNGGAQVAGSHVAAKTGTSNFDEDTMEKYDLPYYAVNDLWTIAYTSQYSISVWYGYKDVTIGYNINGDGYKESLTREVMKYIPKDTKGFTMPSSVVACQVEKGTVPAKLPSENTPSDMILTEYFVKGTEPTEVSLRYQTLNDVEKVTTTKNGNSVTLTWNYTKQKVNTEEYLKEYFSQTTFGNQSNKYYQERINYNNNTLGGIGFGIYLKDSTGNLSLVGYTEENTFTYTGYGNIELVIKTEFKNFKSNQSKGYTVTNINLGDNPGGKIIASLNGELNTTKQVNNYIESGFKYIYYNKIDITSTANIKYQVSVSNELKEFNDKITFENYINTLPAGTYNITYIISYLNEELTKTRNLTLK